jgi:hypothetical protein
MLQNYSKDMSIKEKGDGILVQDSLNNSKETLTYRPGGGGGLTSKHLSPVPDE